MSQTIYFLAFARLAPVQIVSFGHPETTGINTIDYFLSSTLLEPDNKKKYSERLILFRPIAAILSASSKFRSIEKPKRS